MRPTNDINTYQTILEENSRKVENINLAVFATSGHAKGLALEGIAEEFHKRGYTIIVLSDPKMQVEYGYAQFMPTEKYHIDHLRKMGKMPSTIPVKLYHPFTFNIPKLNLPEINFYTFNIKDLNREEWSMLFETPGDAETINLILKGIDDISNTQGFYTLLHYIQESVLSKRYSRIAKPEPKNFYLKTKVGEQKSLKDIALHFNTFKKDFMIADSKCGLNLDFASIMNDNQNYHVFFTNWIKDEKIIDFVFLCLYMGFLRNRDLSKNPVCFIIPEIRHQLPENPKGWKVFIAEALKKNLSTVRSTGRGISTLMDSQSFTDTNPLVKNSANVTFFGSLAPGDADRVCKTLGYSNSIKSLILSMERGQFIISGKRQVGEEPYMPFFPSHAHCEPNTNFFDEYKEYFRERMKKYDDVIDYMQKKWDEEEERIKEKVKAEERRERERIEEIRKVKEKQKEESLGVEKKIERAKEIQSKSKNELIRLVYEAKQKIPVPSNRQIAKEFKISNKTVKLYIEKYKPENSQPEKEAEIVEEFEGEEDATDA